MSIKSELLALKDNDGLIVAEVAVEWARAHPKSDLYAAINWDTGWNVEQYLLVQMRKLITLNIVTEEKALHKLFRSRSTARSRAAAIEKFPMSSRTGNCATSC